MHLHSACRQPGLRLISTYPGSFNTGLQRHLNLGAMVHPYHVDVAHCGSIVGLHCGFVAIHNSVPGTVAGDSGAC